MGSIIVEPYSRGVPEVVPKGRLQRGGGGGGGGNNALNLPGCVSMKVMDMGVVWLQVSEVSRHLSTQNESQICPFTPFERFLWTLSTGYGYLLPIHLNNLFGEICN